MTAEELLRAFRAGAAVVEPQALIDYAPELVDNVGTDVIMAILERASKIGLGVHTADLSNVHEVRAWLIHGQIGAIVLAYALTDAREEVVRLRAELAEARGETMADIGVRR